MADLITQAQQDGSRIIYIDETMFTRRAVRQVEYCLPKLNSQIPQSKLNAPTKALLMGISREKGLEHWHIFNKSVDNIKLM